MTAVALTTLIAAVRARADMTDSTFVDDDTEVTPWINEEAGKLHDLLVSRFEDQYTVATDSIVVTSGATITLADSVPGFYKLRGIDRLESGDTDWQEIRPFDFNRRNRRTSGGSWYRSRVVQYRLVGPSILLSPDDASTGTYRVWYIPSFTPLVAPDDEIDFPESWHEYVIAGAAAKCLAKEESDPSLQLGMQAKIEATILAMAANRDAGSRMRIEDVRRRRTADDDGDDY